MNLNQILKAKSLIKENKYCLEAWSTLIKDAQELNTDESRQFFENLIEEFPTCGRFWKVYIEQELFDRCLNKVLNIDLWKCYLSFIKEISVNNQNAKDVISNAYELALDKIGLDVMSYTVWIDYVQFLKSLNTSDTFDDANLVNKIRSVYQLGITNPMINVEQFWKDYCAFEMQLNPDGDLIDETTHNFSNIKKIAREYENVTRPLERHMPAVTPQVNNEELKQIYTWKKYISWEKQNPLNSTDRNYVIRRVMFAYEQSFLCLAYHADIWYEATSYLYEQSKQFKIEGNDQDAGKYSNEASELYERAVSNFMKNSLLLHLAYAGYEEERSNMDKAKEIYDRCLQNSQLDITLVIIQYMRFMYRTKGIKAARDIFKLGREDLRTTYHLYIAAADMEYLCTKDKSVAFKIFQLGAKKFPNNIEFMLAYIKYMSHLNEDNNTRVLFERILSSNELPKDGTDEIWAEFLKFECYCGDLASILKVDKKRQKVIEAKEDFEKNDTTLVIDRYKFLDLLPCNSMELKTLGYKEIKTNQMQYTSIINSKSFNMGSLNSGLDSQFRHEPRMKLKYPSPDETQMLPFKPVRNALPGSHAVSGGIFPFPPSVSELVKKLPPPHLFQGPFVVIDDLINSFLIMEINENFQQLYVYIGGEPMKDIGAITSQANSSKRMIQNQPDSDEEDTKKTRTDIYTQRLHKKFLKT